MKPAAFQSAFSHGRRRALSAAAFVITALALGCATGPATRVGVDEVMRQPKEYKNERVELTGLVEDYKPVQGDIYRTLIFTLAQAPEEKILVVGAGYTAEAIAKASFLLEQAYEAKEPITVVGKLKLNEKAPPEVQLESIRYRGQEVKITGGPRTRPGGLSIGGGVVTGSIGIGATITP
jgi:hypothetical protein